MADRDLTVLLIGHGEMGHAFDYLLSPRHQVRIWQRHPDKGRMPFNLERAAAESDFIVFCVPANPVAELAARIGASLNENSICLCIAKGLDAQGRPAARILHDVYGDRFDFGVLYGPMISEEIRAGRPGFAQMGCSNADVYKQTASLFDGTRLYLEHTTDMTGVSWCAVLKNVYAMLFGIADELRLGDNMRGYLAVSANHELAAIVTQLGGKASTPSGLAGLGDLITTATSEGSHHHELGRLLVRGELSRIEGEGVHALAMVRQFKLLDLHRYPLAHLIDGIIQQPVDIKGRLAEHLASAYGHL